MIEQRSTTGRAINRWIQKKLEITKEDQQAEDFVSSMEEANNSVSGDLNEA